MPLDHACMTDQEFSCGFKSHAIGEQTNGLSKSNQSLRGLLICTDFCSEFAQIKSLGETPNKSKVFSNVARSISFFLMELNPLFVH